MPNRITQTFSDIVIPAPLQNITDLFIKCVTLSTLAFLAANELFLEFKKVYKDKKVF